MIEHYIDPQLLRLCQQEALDDIEESGEDFMFLHNEDDEIILFSYEKTGGALDFFAKNAKESAELCTYSLLWDEDNREKQIAYEMRRNGL